MCMSFRTYRRDGNPFETYTKGRLFVVDVSINWPSDRNWQTKILDSWEAAQLNLLRQKSVDGTVMVSVLHAGRWETALSTVSDTDGPSDGSRTTVVPAATERRMPDSALQTGLFGIIIIIVMTISSSSSSISTVLFLVKHAQLH